MFKRDLLSICFLLELEIYCSVSLLFSTPTYKYVTVSPDFRIKPRRMTRKTRRRSLKF
jgi:hypothetical protein